MKTIHLIVVGKNKEKSYLALEEDYLKRLKNFILKIHEVKAHEENLNLEAKEVTKKLTALGKGSPLPFFLMTEKGKLYNSLEFSRSLENKLQNFNEFALIIGGASGHGKELYDLCSGELSLSPLTMPHKMARLVLIEQIYRAETIIQGHPYNK